MHTVTLILPDGYASPEEFAEDCGFELAPNSHDALVTELKLIADWRKVSLAGEYEHSLRDVIRSMLDCADRALASIKDTV